ncbi:hypothetical protein BGZ95_009339, partial [Linnemannia exigua]
GASASNNKHIKDAIKDANCYDSSSGATSTGSEGISTSSGRTAQKPELPDLTANLEHFKALNHDVEWIVEKEDLVQKFREFRAHNLQDFSLVRDGIADMTIDSKFRRSLAPNVGRAASRVDPISNLHEHWPTSTNILERVREEPPQHSHYFSFYDTVPTSINERQGFEDLMWSFIRGAMTMTGLETRYLEILITGVQERKNWASSIHNAKAEKLRQDEFKLSRAMKDSWVSQVKATSKHSIPRRGIAVFGSSTFNDETKFWRLDFCGVFRLVHFDTFFIPLKKSEFGRKAKEAILRSLILAIRIRSEVSAREDETKPVDHEIHELLQEKTVYRSPRIETRAVIYDVLAVVFDTFPSSCYAEHQIGGTLQTTQASTPVGKNTRDDYITDSGVVDIIAPSSTNTTVVVPDTSISLLSTDDSSSDLLSPATGIQTFLFSLPPPPLLLTSPTPAHNACLELPQLTNTPLRQPKSRSTMPQHFIILPQGWTTGSQLKNSQLRYQLFRLCVCGPHDPDEHTWDPHLLDEPRPNVRDPQQFIDLFAPTLLLSTKMFLASLHISQDPTGSTSTSLPAASFSVPREAFEHIQKELGLFDFGEVETLLGRMITYLEEALLPRQDAADSLRILTPRNFILERSRLSLKDMDLLSRYVDLDRSYTPSAYLNFDKNGNDLWVCRHHYRCLDPGFRMSYVKRTIKRFGSYHAATGKIDVHLREPKDLALLCRIDPIKASRITDLKVALEWSLSLVELTQLVDWARSLDLTTLSMTGRSSGAGPSSASSRSLAATEVDTTLVKNIIRSSHNQLATVTINWDSDLDAATLIQEASLEGHSLQFLTIKTDRQEVLTVMFKSQLGIDHVISELGDLPLESRGSFLARKVQNLTIGPCNLSTNMEQAAAWRVELSSAFQENRLLTSLTAHCKAKDFRTILDILHSILRELYTPPSTGRHPLSYIILKDPQNDITAKFNLTPLDHQSPAIIDVQAGTNGLALFPLIRNYGAFIRVLNLIDNSVTNTFLLKTFARSKPTQLVSLMLTLYNFVPQSGDDLSEILTLSKNTFKQLTLIGYPRTSEAVQSLLNVIRSLHGCDVLITRTEAPDVWRWVERVQRVIDKSSRVIAVTSAEEVRLMVPGRSPSGLK